LRLWEFRSKSGRDFNDGDLRDQPFVAVINEALAGSRFPARILLAERSSAHSIRIKA
jgi:hypothetical protein